MKMFKVTSLTKQVLFSLFVAMSMGIANQAFAATYTVNSTGDAGGVSACDGTASCTLRQAIAAANVNPGIDNIVFDSTVFPNNAVHNITISSSLKVTDNVNITGVLMGSGTPAINIKPGVIALPPNDPTNGTIVVEAENFTSRGAATCFNQTVNSVPNTQVCEQWYVMPDEAGSVPTSPPQSVLPIATINASGGKYMRFLPSFQNIIGAIANIPNTQVSGRSATNKDPFQDLLASKLSYTVNVPVAGTYQLFLRYEGTFYARIDGTPGGTYYMYNNPNGDGNFNTQTLLGDASVGSSAKNATIGFGANDGPALFTLSAGTHTVEFIHRGNGAALDSFVLQKVNPNPVASGYAENFTASTTNSIGQKWYLMPNPNITSATIGGVSFPATDANPTAPDGKYMEWLPNLNGTNNTDISNAQHSPFGSTLASNLSYPITIPAAGDYQVYVGFAGFDGSSDSLYVRILELTNAAFDGLDTPEFFRIGHNSMRNAPTVAPDFSIVRWQGEGGFENNNSGGNDSPMMFHFPAAGTYTLQFSAREDGVAVDSYMIRNYPFRDYNKPLDGIDLLVPSSISGSSSISGLAITGFDSGIRVLGGNGDSFTANALASNTIGINISSGDTIEVSGNSFTSNNNGFLGASSNNLYVHNNNGVDNSTYLHLTQTNNSRVISNTMANTLGATGISVEQSSRNNVIQQNTLTSVSNLGTGMFLSVDIDGTDAASNTIDNFATGISVTECGPVSPLTLESNTITRSFSGITFTRCLNSQIKNNYLGTDSTGRSDRGGNIGMQITRTTGATISGNTVAYNTSGGLAINSNSDNNTIQNNVIIGNSKYGLAIMNDSDNNLVSGNKIGVDGSGNPIGNSGVGIRLGAVVTIDRNPVSTTFKQILFPTDAVGTVRNIPDPQAPMRGPQNTNINNNTIAYNASVGVLVGADTDDFINAQQVTQGLTFAPNLQSTMQAQDGSAKGVLLSNNKIYSNNDLGIDLVTKSANGATINYFNGSVLSGGTSAMDAFASTPDGVTANPGDVNMNGGNDLQNFPTLYGQRSFLNPAQVQVWGCMNGALGHTYMIEVFSNLFADPSGFGEGQMIIGVSDPVTITSAGCVDFHFHSQYLNDPIGNILTATATDLSTGETSEFSAVINAGVKGSPTAFENADKDAKPDNNIPNGQFGGDTQIDSPTPSD